MDPETLTALAESLEQHTGPLSPDDLGPYLDAACEALERAGGREVVAVVEWKLVQRWGFTGWSPRYDPPVEASGELSRLVGALALRFASHTYPRGELFSSRLGRRIAFAALPWEAEVVIDAQRWPRATFHQSLNWDNEYPLERASDLYPEMERAGISLLACDYRYDHAGLVLDYARVTPSGVVEPGPPLREMIRDRIQETLNQATWPLGEQRAVGRVVIDRPQAHTRVTIEASARGEALAKVD